jgi:hypothetical protein
VIPFVVRSVKEETMRKKLLFISLLVALLSLSGTAIAAPGGENRNFRAHLSGKQEVPVRETQAQGQAIFKVSKDGDSLSYKVIVANIDNVRAAHIHCAPVGQSGPVGVTLFSGGGLGPVNGVLAEGTATAPDGANGCGWVELDDVVAAIVSGNAYVNVHTNDGVDPTNTGPGDFPGGEIRGQIE